MFTCQELYDTYMAPRIDATGSQRYLPDQDIIPSANSAIGRGLTAGNWALANRKGSEEQLIELKEDRIFQSNQYGGISINSCVPGLDHQVWSVIAIYAEPTSIPTAAPVLTSGANTYFISNAVPTGSKYPVERKTAEELAVAQDNIFMNGNEVFALMTDGVTLGPKRSYAYYYMGRRANQNVESAADGTYFIKPFPLSAKKMFWVSYLRTPAVVSLMGDAIDFPRSMMQVIGDWALEYISWKQGDQTTLHSVAEKDAMQLFNLSAL